MYHSVTPRKVLTLFGVDETGNLMMVSILVLNGCITSGLSLCPQKMTSVIAKVHLYALMRKPWAKDF